MQALTLISSTITPLKTNHTGEDSLKKMDQFRINHLPIVNNNFYLGIISDKEINNWESKKDPISEHIPNIVSPHVLENQHLFDEKKKFYLESFFDDNCNKSNTVDSIRSCYQEVIKGKDLVVKTLTFYFS